MHQRMGRKNLIAIGIYLAAIPLSWVFVPLALLLIATPAAMYFLPDRQVEKLHAPETNGVLSTSCLRSFEPQRVFAGQQVFRRRDLRASSRFCPVLCQVKLWTSAISSASLSKAGARTTDLTL